MMPLFRSIKIGELGKVVTGKTPTSIRPELFGAIYPFLTPTDIDGHARYVQPSRFLSEAGRISQPRLLLPRNAVCVVCIGATIGKTCIARVPSFTNQQINAVVVNEAVHDPFFVYHVLTTLRDDLRLMAGGAATPIINKSAFSDIEINVPPLPIQHRIAGILSAYDDLIENSQRRIKILEEMARRLYREWFVHFRFPGHESYRLVESSLGEIPEGWEVKSLGDIAVVNRSTINMRNPPNRLGYIDIASVSPGRVESVTDYLFSEAPGRARRIVSHGDVLWSCVRPNRRSHAQVMHPEENTIASTGFAVLTALKVPATFLYQATTTDEFVAYLTNNATGAAYPAVTAPTFENAKLVVPETAWSQSFGELTIPMTEEVHVIQRQVDNLRRTRDLLLPRLLSGQIDVEALPEPALSEP